MTLDALPLEAVNVTKHFGREGPALWQRLARRSNGHKPG